jgi:hypothetical protein
MPDDDLRADVWADDGVLVVRPNGLLTVGNYALLRDCLLKCVAEQPRAVLVELGDLLVASPSLLSVFAAVWMRTASWPAVPLVLAASREPLRSTLRQSAVPRFVATHDTLAAARESIDRPPPRRRLEYSTPATPCCGRRVRRFVRDVCARWHLEPLREDLMLVANALTDNAVTEGEQQLSVRVELRADQLSVAVRSADPRVRRPSRGPLDPVGSRGLAIVAAVCSAWGHAPTADGGKLTWGVLRVPRHSPVHRSPVRPGSVSA